MFYWKCLVTIMVVSVSFSWPVWLGFLKDKVSIVQLKTFKAVHHLLISLTLTLLSVDSYTLPGDLVNCPVGSVLDFSQDRFSARLLW